VIGPYGEWRGQSVLRLYHKDILCARRAAQKLIALWYIPTIIPNTSVGGWRQLNQRVLSQLTYHNGEGPHYRRASLE
jgi:hypothetical protein